MKIIFTLDSLANAGTEKSMLDIISNFSSEIQVRLVYFYPGGELKQAYEKAGIPLELINLEGKQFLLHGVRKLKEIILKENPDLVVSSILQANLISRIACKLTKTRLVGTFVSDSYSSARIKGFSFKRKVGFYFYYRLDRLTARIPSAWISNSICIKESNCKFLNVDPSIVKVIYRGRDSSKFIYKQRVPSQGVFRFIYLGRLLKTKGLRELVEAFKLLISSNQQASLDIYGAGPFRQELLELIKTLNLEEKVFLHGVVANGWEKLYEADCFVFPSWYEGFSGSLVEAMFVGIPIIASDIPMNLEAVTDNVTALIHRVKDPANIAKQMTAAIAGHHSMKEMGARAREEAIRRFDIKVIAAEYENFLSGVHRQH